MIPDSLAKIALVLADLSILLHLWQWILAWRFPLHRRDERDSHSPSVSILKPLKGCDSETEGCLESWFRQEYTGGFELLFATASPDDPVCEIVRRLTAKYPEKESSLIIAEPILGPNAKVSSLTYLAKSARFEYFVISDADVYAEPNLVQALVSDLHDPTVGLVNCFYILAAPTNLPMRLEALAANADFWSQVLQAIAIRPMDFALGAAMAVRKVDLQNSGGFEPLLPFLADDFQLGQRIVNLPRRLKICPQPVECRAAPCDWREFWDHQIRWARTIRTCRPVAYFFSILGNTTLWAVAALLADLRWGVSVLVTALSLRMLGAVSKYRKLTGRFEWWVIPLAPVQDLIQSMVWAAAFLGNRVVWRGERFQVDRGGKLTHLA